MNVTLRPDGYPDVMFDGKSQDIESINKQIRALLVARRWLRAEMAKRNAARS